MIITRIKKSIYTLKDSVKSQVIVQDSPFSKTFYSIAMMDLYVHLYSMKTPE